MQNKKCKFCIRECQVESSFCNRRDELGVLKDKRYINALSFDYLFDKPILHFSNNIKVLSIGSWGCNLRCIGCQNATLSWNTSGDDLNNKIMLPDEIIELAILNNCKGICYTYNEPAIMIDFVEEVATKAKKSGLFNFLITNSTFTSYSVNKIAPLINAVATDIKSMNDNFYYKYCGAEGINDVANKILQCIKEFSILGCHVEIRTNLIPGYNDDEQNLRTIAYWIKENLGENIPWHLTRFFPAHKLADISKM